LSGINYYRLKIKDKNGRITYSTVIAILNPEAGFEIASVFPTLTESTVFINTSSTRNMNLNFAILNMQGRVVQKGVRPVQQGSDL
jgi:hypothetical protein